MIGLLRQELTRSIRIHAIVCILYCCRFRSASESCLYSQCALDLDSFAVSRQMDFSLSHIFDSFAHLFKSPNGCQALLNCGRRLPVVD